MPTNPEIASARRTLKEIEDGGHPSQAAMLLRYASGMGRAIHHAR